MLLKDFKPLVLPLHTIFTVPKKESDIMKILHRCQAILLFAGIALRVVFRNHFYHIKKMIAVFKRLYSQHAYKQNQTYID